MGNGWPIRKDAQEKLLAFELLAKMPGLLIIVTNTRFELLYANNYFYEFFDCTPNDLLGKALYGFLSDDIRPDMNKAHIAEVIKDGRVWDYTAATVTPDGEPVSIKWNQELMLYDKKTPVIFSVGVLREDEKINPARVIHDYIENNGAAIANMSAVAHIPPRAGKKTVHLVDGKSEITEEDIEEGLERGWFKLYYQPLIQVRAKKIVGAEALLRFEHPERGRFLPGSILPVAEKTGQIIPLGKFVANAACVKIKDWTDAGLDLTLSVNFSCQQFLHDEFSETLLRAVTLHDVAAGRLLLDVTEDTIFFDTDKVREIIRTLRGLGCKICLDDFGTGFSSLKALESLEIDNLKVDRSFLPSEENNRKSYALIEGIIMLAHGLGFTVTAAGIETDTQAEKLMEMSCDYFQGFLFSRPVPEKDFDRLLLDTPEFYLRNV